MGHLPVYMGDIPEKSWNGIKSSTANCVVTPVAESVADLKR